VHRDGSILLGILFLSEVVESIVSRGKRGVKISPPCGIGSALVCGLGFSGFPDAVFYGVAFGDVDDDGEAAVVADHERSARNELGYLWGAGWDADEGGHAEGFAGHFVEGIAPAFERARLDAEADAHAVDAIGLHHCSGNELDFEGIFLASLLVWQHDEDALHAFFCLWERFEFFVFGCHSCKTGEVTAGE
jgi:hypothetical protein